MGRALLANHPGFATAMTAEKIHVNLDLLFAWRAFTDDRRDTSTPIRVSGHHALVNPPPSQNHRVERGRRAAVGRGRGADTARRWGVARARGTVR
jgi:hypothetical protein